ncbi:MAG: hypothetical protein IKR59_09750, partial [Lachnospiraceae bacterium]|nr:hypothetical protein [Lachnospiraceae bacterium]
MKQTEKKFRLNAVAAIFVLVTVLMGILNIVNFTMAARDADQLTVMISQKKGFSPDVQGEFTPQGNAFDGQSGAFGAMGPMGPDSPEMTNSLRYFTVGFKKDGTAVVTEYRISAVSKEEAVSWAQTLLSSKTGWTRGTYRYRVYKENGVRYVTVIDQGREMISAYRTLVFSVCGIVVVTLLSWIFLKLAGKKIFAPVEEAERKQKRFIEKAEKEFRLPLTVISAETELLQRENGP